MQAARLKHLGQQVLTDMIGALPQLSPCRIVLRQWFLTGGGGASINFHGKASLTRGTALEAWSRNLLLQLFYSQGGWDKGQVLEGSGEDTGAAKF